jgi:polysaccharide export outer membrane protein
MMPLRAISACATLLALVGCGVVYTTPTVTDQPTSGTDYDVEVVPLTYETAVGANLQPYIPARLPLAFQVNAAELLEADPALARRLPRRPADVGVQPMTTENLPPAGEPQRYRIGIGDVLVLAVKQETTSIAGLPALITAQSKRTGYTVQDDGAIAVPDAGRIPVADLTLQEAEPAIFRALAAAGIDPSFSLEVAEFHSQRVTIRGMVGTPTVVPITLQPLHLEDALTIAGGVTAEDPGSAWIQIYRDPETFRIKLARFLREPELGQVLLTSGDRVYVGATLDDEETHRMRQEGVDRLLANDRALFEQRLKYGAIEQPYAFLTGEVGRAVEIPLPFERTLSLANVLFSAKGGGLDMTTADYAEIYVLRAETDPQKAGGVTAYHLDAENAANLLVATEFRIHANDVVFVSPQPVTNWNRVLSQIVVTPQLLLSAPTQISP